MIGAFWKATKRKLYRITVVDPGFPRGVSQSQREPGTYNLANFSRKLHDNEEILGQRGVGAHPSHP